MTTLTEKLPTRWQDATNLVLGVWLSLSPWALGYMSQATPAWNARVVGVVIAVTALAALFAFQQREEWVRAALGAWLIVSPYLLGFAALSTALWNQIIVGFVVGVLAIWTAVNTASGLTAKR